MMKEEKEESGIIRQREREGNDERGILLIFLPFFCSPKKSVRFSFFSVLCLFLPLLNFSCLSSLLPPPLSLYNQFPFLILNSFSFVSQPSIYISDDSLLPLMILSRERKGERKCDREREKAREGVEME